MSTNTLSWFTRAAGRPSTFVAAVVIILLWVITGSLFPFSDSWQLVFNTVTTIITYLMVFLIQKPENRDTDATRNTMIDLEGPQAIQEDKDGKFQTVRKKLGGK